MSLATLRRRAPSCSAFLRPVYTLGLFTFVACRLSAQITLQTRDFEDLPVGAGNLSPAFTTIAYGPGSVGSGSIISHDPIQGVLASSPLGDGKAGYLGGGGTGIILDPGAGVFGTEVFDGSPAENATKTVQLKGSLTPVVTVSTDLLVQRVNSGNAQSFWIEFYDAQNVFGSGFAAHSAVWINPDNTVSIRDNQNTGLVSTGLTLLSDTAYHLKLTVDYNAAT